MKKCVITGGCGFLGRNLCLALLKKGRQVLILDDMSTGEDLALWLPPALRSSVDLVVMDCATPDASEVIRHFSKSQPISGFYHFAGIVGGRKTIENSPFYVSKNLHIDLAVMACVAEIGVEHFVYPSSSAVYPVALQQDIDSAALSEKVVDTDRFQMPDQTYGWAKLTGEFHCRILHERYGIPVTIVRPFSGYGPDQALTYPIPAIVRRYAQRQDPMEVWGSGRQRRDFLFIDDLIDGIFVAMENFANAEPVNLATGISTSFEEVLATLSRLTDFSPTIERKSNFPSGVFNRHGSIEKIKPFWQPQVSLEAGLVRVLTKYKDG